MTITSTLSPKQLFDLLYADFEMVAQIVRDPDGKRATIDLQNKDYYHLHFRDNQTLMIAYLNEETKLEFLDKLKANNIIWSS